MGKALGIVSLIFGIIGTIVSMLIILPMMGWGFSALAFFPYIPNIVAIICGSIGIKKDDSPGLAIAGLVLGCVGVVIAVVATFIGIIRINYIRSFLY